MFRAKASEEDLFLAALRASALTWSKQLDDNTVISDRDVRSLVDFSFSERKVKPSKSQRRTAAMIVDALLAEGDYIKSVTEKMVSGKFSPNKTDHELVISICESKASEFLNSLK